jgi:ABC-type lipopolysaccharide export system ATPase subunit
MIHSLEADSIQLEFNGRKILSNIYIKTETGLITGLLGRNGEGKTCLMNAIFGTLKCEKSVRIDNVSEANAYRRKDIIRYLPQFNFIPKHLSLKRIFSDFEIEYSYFERNFPEFSSNYKNNIGNLSGGDRRLVEIYVIVKSNSYFAMLDEPFTHLNPIQIEKVKELFIEERENKGLIITDHIYNHIINICTYLYVLVNGKTFLTDSVEDLERLGYARIWP